MDEKTLKIIYEANKDNKILSQDNIYDIFISLIARNSLNQYCTNINTNKNNEFALAYSFKNHELLLNYKKLLSKVKNMASEIKKMFEINKEEVIKYINYEILFASLHELNHAFHEKIMDGKEKSVSFEFKILLDYYLEACKQFTMKEYLANHKYFYNEYLADINSYYVTISKILKEIEDSSLITYIFNVALANFLSGRYEIKEDKIISPIENFNRRCLNKKSFDIDFFQIINQGIGNIEDILQGKMINKQSLEHIDSVNKRYIRTLNLFNDIYPIDSRIEETSLIC